MSSIWRSAMAIWVTSLRLALRWEKSPSNLAKEQPALPFLKTWKKMLAVKDFFLSRGKLASRFERRLFAHAIVHLFVRTPETIFAPMITQTP